MASPILHFVLLLHLMLAQLVLSYKIDASCTQMGYYDMIRSAMASAFEMAQAAESRLSANPWTDDTEELIRYLFAKDGQRRVSRDSMGKTTNVFRDIRIHYRDEIIGDEELDFTNVIVFCNFDRFVTVNEKKNEFRDQVSGIYTSYDPRPCKGSLLDKVALAVTDNPTKDQVWINNRLQPYKFATQIQLCPWFLDWLKEKKFKLHRDVKRTNIGRWFLEGAEKEKGRFGFKQIDVFSLLDKVLLHEMTHGRMAYTRTDPDRVEYPGLDDVRTPGWSIFGIPAYGWTRAMMLAKMGEDLGGEYAADHNSDTLALFGSVCKLLDDEAEPRRKVDVNGRVVPRG